MMVKCQLLVDPQVDVMLFILYIRDGAREILLIYTVISVVTKDRDPVRCVSSPLLVVSAL